jgi:hypothetical protein
MTPTVQSAFYEGLKTVRRSYYAYSGYFYTKNSVVVSIAWPVGYMKYLKQMSAVFQMIDEIKDGYWILLLQSVCGHAI